MSIIIPKAGDIEISEVVSGLVARRERYWAQLNINAKFSARDRWMIERAMMDHRNASADIMMKAATYIVNQIESPWIATAKR